MDLFYTSLEEILNINSEQFTTLITQFNTGDLAFFQTYFNMLPTAKLQLSNEKNATANTTLFIKSQGIGAGDFGTIYKNKSSPFVYKRIEDEERVNDTNSLKYLQTGFKEAIIQILLQSDTTYGKHICRLYKVYRDGLNFVFKMEPLEITLETYIVKNRWTSADQTILPNIILKIVMILNYFNTTYGFFHNDLSTSNIMTVETGDPVENLKLIDFGLSMVKIGDIQLGTRQPTAYDPTFLRRLIQEVNPKYSGALEKIIKLPPETPAKVLTNIFSTNTKQSAGVIKRRTRKSKTRKNHKKLSVKS
jgi:serine/threonine protein kinase